MPKTKTKFFSSSIKLTDYLEVIDLIQRVGLLLEVGYDFGYAWKEAHSYLKNRQTVSFLKWEESTDQGFVESYHQSLTGLNDVYLTFWLKHLLELHLQRGPMREAIMQFDEFLWKEVQKEMGKFRKKLPMQLNVIIMLFFLPPFFIIIFLPLTKLLFSF